MPLAAPTPYKPRHKIRFVTATSLFDGHDASINVIRRLLQASGAEVIHLGHNRSVQEVVAAAIQEDAQGIGVSCYQGGHIEFFKYMVDLLRQRGAGHIKVFGGGGGVIVPDEIAEIEGYGVRKIFSPEDGRRMGLQGMINLMLEECDFANGKDIDEQLSRLARRDIDAVNSLITLAELAVYDHTRLRLRRGAGEDPGAGPGRAGGRHYRARRRRQELAHRRAGAAVQPRLPRQERGHPGGRSVAPAHRRGVAGRPDPDERDQFRPDLHALAGHPPVAVRALRRHPRRDRRCAGGRFRPGAGGNQRHWPGERRRGRRLRRSRST